MQENYGRDLDLNLLRVFLVVADVGSVTGAAARLYLTQPAVSAPLFVRKGRSLALSSRGEALRQKAQLHLSALVDAALSPQRFEPLTSERVLRLGLADAAEAWLLPRLLRAFAKRAPRMSLIVVPVQFRTVGEALASGRVDVAVTVADPLPASIKRQVLIGGDLVCLFDPRHARVGQKLTERAYFEHEHVIVSYNADLRGIVEDLLQKQRRTRCSVSSFANVPALVEGSALLATVPRLVAQEAVRHRPGLALRDLPFQPSFATTDLLWPAAAEDDDASRFLREQLLSVAATLSKPARRRKNAGPARRAAT
jgi:LysR family transcriptional regulator, mexEF-oprN operon transcriptional activator